MKLGYKHTYYASYLGYITQAISINLLPLFFVLFQNNYKISFEQISMIITLNFLGQMSIDALATKIIPKFGVRNAVVFAHISASAGLVLLSFLPDIFFNPFIAILISTLFTSIGGGLTEVLISPIVNSIPNDDASEDKKSMNMSLLHSFFSWGTVLIVLGTTMFFKFFGQQNWQVVPIIWAVIPFLNIFYFSVVKLPVSIEEDGEFEIKGLFKSKIFIVFLFLMVCSGASEMAMCQWSSLFAETGLGVSKEVGDILGPCFFAVLMGLSRVLYTFAGGKIKLKNALILSSFLCVLSYAITVFAPNPVVSLLGCAFCGFAAGLMWPGILSLCAQYHTGGSSAMFAYLALAGDLGCLLSPMIVGQVSGFIAANVKTALPIVFSTSITEYALKIGILVAMIFPLFMFLRLIFLKKDE